MGEQHSDIDVLESSSVNFEGNVTRKLTERWLRGSDGVRWTDDLGHVKGVQVIVPSVVPSAVDYQSSLPLVVGHGRVLSWRWDIVVNFWIRSIGVPPEGSKVKDAGGVDIGAEASGGSLLILGAFSTENEEFPRWDGFHKGSAVVPSWDVVVDIWISPFLGLKVENPDVVELHLSVPSTIDVDLVVTGEERVSSSSVWRIVVWHQLLPSLSRQVEAVKVVEGHTGVVQTSMTTENVHFIVVNAGADVGSGAGSADGGLNVASVVLVGSHSSPFHGLHVEEPGVVQSSLRAVMSSEDEHLVSFWGVQSDVLGSWQWLLGASGLGLCPGAVNYTKKV